MFELNFMVVIYKNLLRQNITYRYLINNPFVF
jgi:hypothetical protein